MSGRRGGGWAGRRISGSMCGRGLGIGAGIVYDVYIDDAAGRAGLLTGLVISDVRVELGCRLEGAVYGTMRDCP